MLKYTSRDGSAAVERDDGYIVGPEDATAWAEYQEWLAAGNTPAPVPTPPPPKELTPKEKLEAAGLTIDELKSLLGLGG